MGEVFLKDYQITAEYTVIMGTAPQLQTTVQGTMSDGSTVQGSVVWSEVTKEMYSTPGEYLLDGMLKIGKEEIPVHANLHVRPIVAGVKNYSRATTAGIVPALPKTVQALLPDGSSYGAYPVTWDAVTAEDFEKVGTIVTVQGTAVVEDDVKTVSYTHLTLPTN